MKRISIFLSILIIMFVASNALATKNETVSKATISDNVNSLVTMIDDGKKVSEVKADTFDPYAFIIQTDGTILVHPTLIGKNLKEENLAAYTAIMQASAEGVWVQYEYHGKVKQTYTKKTKSNLIVGSGF